MNGFPRGSLLLDCREVHVGSGRALADPQTVEPFHKLELVLSALQCCVAHPLHEGQQVGQLFCNALGENFPHHAIQGSVMKPCIAPAKQFHAEMPFVTHCVVTFMSHFLPEAAQNTICVRACQGQDLDLTGIKGSKAAICLLKELSVPLRSSWTSTGLTPDPSLFKGLMPTMEGLSWMEYTWPCCSSKESTSCTTLTNRSPSWAFESWLIAS